MIKDLIRDLTFDKITLTQALTRAKLIAYEINNQSFKEWINNEVNGYTSDNLELPPYRMMPCDVLAVVEGYGEKRTIPMDLSSLDKELDGKMYKLLARQSISTIEENIKGAENEPYGYEDFPQPLVTMISNLVDNKFITKVRRRVQISQYRAVLSITKQKLLDTLLEFNLVFPNLENSYQETAENTSKVNTIVNNHIYGDHTSSNVAIGNNISQSISDSYNQKVEKFILELQQMGVPEEDFKEVETILKNETNKKTLSKRLWDWVGKMSGKVVEKSIELQIPLLIAKVNDFL